MATNAEKFNQMQLNKDTPDMRVGDTVKVHQKVKEGDKERIQTFEGIIIAKKHGEGISGTMTVRKVIDGVGVEKIIPLHSPFISKIEVLRSGKVRRSKLYYLRDAKGKKGKLKKKDFSVAIADTKPEVSEAPEVSKTVETTQESTEKPLGEEK